MLAMGGEAKGIVIDTPGIDPDDPDTTVESVLKALQPHFRGNQSVTIDRRAFGSAVQRPGETFDAFRTRLKGLASDAALCSVCLETRLTERIIDGVSNEDAHLELLRRHTFPTLAEAVDLCRAYEIADRDARGRRGRRDHGYGEVKAVKSNYKRRQWDEKAARSMSQGPGQVERCYFCGRGAHPRAECPARDATCNGCGKKGHWVTYWNQGNGNKNGNNRQRDQSRGKGKRGQSKSRGSGGNRAPLRGANHYVIVVSGSVCAVGATQGGLDENGFSALRFVKVDLAATAPEGHDVPLGTHTLLPDSGASPSLMGVKEYEGLCEPAGTAAPPIRELTAPLRAANGGPIAARGLATFTVRYRGREIDVPFVITPDYKGILVNCFICDYLDLHSAPFDHSPPTPNGSNVVRFSSPHASRRRPPAKRDKKAPSSSTADQPARGSFPGTNDGTRSGTSMATRTSDSIFGKVRSS